MSVTFGAVRKILLSLDGVEEETLLRHTWL